MQLIAKKNIYYIIRTCQIGNYIFKINHYLKKNVKVCQLKILIK